MQLNTKTSTIGTTQHLGIRVYTDTLDEIDRIADKLNVKRSVIVRHAINEFIDTLKGEA